MTLAFIFVLYIICQTGSGEICDFADDLNTCYKKFLSYEALGNIHKQIDGDRNGQVDSFEADKFVKQEFSSTNPSHKPRSLTEEDPYVSISDFWAMWRKNPAFGWSVKQTVRWLCDVVELPQYSDIFLRHSVDGKSLPLLAMQNMSYLTDVLMIRNPIDKRKLMLKALDTILFGSSNKPQILPSPLTTAAFGILVLLLFGLTHWFYHTKILDGKSRSMSDSPAYSERTLKELQSRLDDLEQIQYRLNDCEGATQLGSLLYSQLQPTWSEFTRLRARASGTRPRSMLMSGDSGSPPKNYFDGSQTRPDSDRRSSALDENMSIPNELDKLGSQSIPEQDLCLPRRQPSLPELDIAVSVELQLWLQLTYVIELEQYKKRKAQAEVQLNAARQACNRLHRKRLHVLGPVRLIYSDSLDELEYKLVQAKCELELLEREFQERNQRWNRIEVLTGLHIRNNPGLEQLRKSLASFQQPEPMLPEACSSTAKFELGPPVTSDSETSRSRMSVSDVVDLVMESRGSSNASNLRRKSFGKMSSGDSFVRPFAVLWRRKAGSRTTDGAPKPH